MKWFFLSILVVYLWFTPGSPLFGLDIPVVPTVEGVRSGLLRVMSLVLVIFAVNYFVTAIARTKLVDAVVWLLYPINWLGINTTTIALRIALALEIIPKVQQIVLSARQDFQDHNMDSVENQYINQKNIVWNKLSAASRIVERLFVRVVDEAMNMQHERITLGENANPPLLQWGIPLTMLVLFVWVKTLYGKY